MNERPILFSGAMVRAIIEGRKTVTRRSAKPVKHPDLGYIYTPGALVLENEPQHVIDRACPYGQPGDRLWVRETWSDVNLLGAPGIAYRADDEVRDLMAEPSFHDEDGAFNYDDKRVKPYSFCCWSEDLIGGVEGRWRPSIHMPRWVSRILLEITAVRVERLQSISDEQAMAEGIVRDAAHPTLWKRGALHGDQNTAQVTAFPKLAFRSLWEAINGHESWAANPWVWVVEFKRLEARA